MIVLWLAAGVIAKSAELPVVEPVTGGGIARHTALNYRDEYDRALVRSLDQAEKALEANQKAKRLAALEAAEAELQRAESAFQRLPRTTSKIDFNAVRSVVAEIALNIDRAADQTSKIWIMIDEAREAERARLFAEDEQIALILFSA